MSTDHPSHPPQSWEHLLENDPHGGSRFRLGMAAATVIHAVIFAVTWPTVAQAPPEEPEEIYIPFPLTEVVAARPEQQPIRIDVPPRRPESPPVIDGPPVEVEAPPTVIFEPPPSGPVVPVFEPDPPPPPPDPPPTTVMVNVDIDPPEIDYKVEPRYTEPARQAGVRGVVVLELLIDTMGVVESIKVHKGLPLGLTKNAVDAVEQWRFHPSTYQGRAVSVRYILTVRFNLS